VPVIVVATIHPLPGKIDDVIDAFRAVIPLVHAEPGCELYALHRTEDTLVMIERWESTDALKVHGKAPALADLGKSLAGLVASAPTVERLEPVPVGDAKGTV
jgi:quinol monooxygenase YgiN